MKQLKLVYLTMTLAALAGCSAGITGPGGAGVHTDSQSLSYDLTENNCPTGAHQFSSQADYCAGLKNDALNNNCADDLRRSEYTQNCGSDYDGPPPVLQPQPTPPTSSTPWPTPVPTATPRPTPTPNPIDLLPPVARELLNAGITVRVFEGIDNGYPFPGEEPFRTRLKRFWDVLEQDKDLLIRRRSVISEIELTEWAEYTGASKQLDLSVDFSAADLAKYLGYVDREVALTKATGLPITLGLMSEDENRITFDDVDHQVSFFESQVLQLKALAPLVQKLDFDSYTSFTFYEAELKLNRESFDTDFKQAYQTLQPLLTFAAFAKTNGIALDSQEVEDVLQKSDQYKQAFAALNNVSGSLQIMHTMGGIKKLSLSYADTIYVSEGTLTVGMSPQGLTLVPGVISALAAMDALKSQSGMAISFSGFELNNNFVECVKRLTARFPVIRGKRKSIKEVSLTESETRFDYGTLYIGSQGTLADLDAVLAKIQ